MSYQHTIGLTINTPGGNVSKSNNYTAAQHAGYDDTIPAATKIQIPNVSVDVSQLVSLVISCDRDVIIRINDDGSPDATVNVTANVPVTWTEDDNASNPLGNVDVTSISADLAAGDDATLLFDAIYN